MFFSHEMVKEGKVEAREYQISIFKVAKENDLLCVLPTGTGKTIIALMLAADRLKKFPNSKVLILAPTKPLVEQHFNFFREVMSVSDGLFSLVTGKVRREERKALYEKARLIFATPQTVENDIKNKVLSLSCFSLIVFDEAHHAVGRYSYPFIARRYRVERGSNRRVLALTASPSHEKEKIKEICRNIGIKKVEIRSEEDEDIKPYIKKKEVEWVVVTPPEGFKNISKLLGDMFKERAKMLKNFGFNKPVSVITKKDLIELRKKVVEKARGANFALLSLVSQLIKIEHAKSLIETQGVGPFNEYVEKLKAGGTKADRSIINDQRMRKVIEITNKLMKINATHPKLSMLCSIVSREFRERPDIKLIIFANYRKSVAMITRALKKIEGVKPVEFFGQREGMSQREQGKRIEKFRRGDYNVLVGTSISEEGLDIPKVDLAIFYEPVPSEIRLIQRRGRVGRHYKGRIIILITKGTVDEAYYWSAKRKERRMKKTLRKMKERGIGIELRQVSIKDFV